MTVSRSYVVRERFVSVSGPKADDALAAIEAMQEALIRKAAGLAALAARIEREAARLSEEIEAMRAEARDA